MKTKYRPYWPLLFATLLAACTTTSNNTKDTFKDTSAVDPMSAASINHCVSGCPTGGSDVTLQRHAYTLNNNAETKFANWVAYKITKDTVGSGRGRQWRQDPDLPDSDTLNPHDYKGANAAIQIGRGHQANLASMSNTPDWQSLNYLSNITPQKDALNNGAWARLEDKERALLKAPGIDAVHVLTGPLYELHIGTLPNATKSHVIPSGYWKLISVGTTPENGMYVSFIMDQDTPLKANFCNYQVTINEIENRSGLTMWTDLPHEVQAILKSKHGQLPAMLGCN